MRVRTTIVFLAVMLNAGALMASSTVPTLSNYDYLLTLPSISNRTGQEVPGSTFQFEFSWVGPLRYNSPPNSDCPAACGPLAGGTPTAPETFSGIGFSADPNHNPEVFINFSDSFGNSVTFTLIEPDAFWAAPGTKYFAPFSNNGTTGASFAVGSPASLEDPDCTACRVTITSAPEPDSLSLLAIGLLGGGLLLTVQNRKKSASISS